MTFPFVFVAENFLAFVYLVYACNFKCLCTPFLCKWCMDIYTSMYVL
ncbi:unnamed protein product, partial [Brassica rapa]